MMRWHIPVIVIALLLPLSLVATSAYAQSPTDTPTPTITAPPPVLPQITDVVLGDYTCPTGTPVGYGTVTPSSLWSLMCDQCVYTPPPTSTPAATRTLSPDYQTLTAVSALTTTPTPTSPSTPTVSPTPVSTPTDDILSCGDYQDEGVYCVDYGNLLAYDIPHHLSPPVYHVRHGAPAYRYLLSQSANIYYRLDVLGYDTWLAQAQHYSGGDVQLTKSYDYFGAVAISHSVVAEWWGYYTIPYPASYVGTDYVPVGQHWYSYHYNNFTPWLRWYIDGNHRMYVSTSPILGDDPTITPTPEPLPSSYCSVVSDDAAMQGFGWTGITTGATACYDLGNVGLWDWVGHIGNLEPPSSHDAWNIRIPWIAHICLTDISLGTLTIYNVVVDLTAVAYIVAVAMLIRNMFVS